MLLSSTRKDWLGNVRGDVLAGIVVALALIPEAIAFSIIAGVDPQVGLYSAFCIPLIMAFFGGRPAMISSWGARRIRKKSYAKVFRASVRAETSRLPVCGSAARRNRRLG